MRDKKKLKSIYKIGGHNRCQEKKAKKRKKDK